MARTASDDPAKQRRAEAARKRTSDPDTKLAEARRTFLYRIRKGTKPNVASMKKYKVTLSEVNKIRAEARLEPLVESMLNGYQKEYDAVVNDYRSKNITESDVVNDVVPAVKVVNAVPKPKEQPTQVKEVDEREMRVITISDYRQLLLETGRDPKTVNNSIINKLIDILATAYGNNWSIDDDIVAPLKKTKKISDAIYSLRQRNGEKYATYSQYFYAISTGMYDGKLGAVKPFMRRFSQKEIDFYNSSFSTLQTSENKKKASLPNKGRKKETPDWKVIQPNISKYILDENTSLQDRCIASIYSGRLGGVPRANTFTNLHIVEAMKDVTSLQKNYIVMARNGLSCTLVSHTHKTGVSTESKRKKGGRALIIKLHENNNSFFNGLRTRLQRLKQQSENNMLFKVDRNYVTKVLKKASGGYDNQQMRRAYETSVHMEPKPSIAKIARTAYIHAHSIRTAINNYVEDTGKTISPADLQREFSSIDAEMDKLKSEKNA